jgi:hypothetical protein
MYARPNSWSPQGSRLVEGSHYTAHGRKTLYKASYFLYSAKIASRGKDREMVHSIIPDCRE